MNRKLFHYFFYKDWGSKKMLYFLLIISMNSNIEFYYEYEDTYDGS